VDSPRFTVCPSSSGAVCNVGSLAEGQSDELQATVRVRKAADLGEQIKLAAAARGTGAAAFSASAAAVAVSAAPPPRTPASSTPAPVTLPPLPNLGGINATDPSGLFPTVSPAPSTSAGPSAGTRSERRTNRIRAATTSATLPLSPRVIGGQLAGLAVLAGAIAMAIARLSLRAPRPQGGKDTSG
jgi:hypothetical protein